MAKCLSLFILILFWGQSLAFEIRECSDYFTRELEAAYEQTSEQGSRLTEEMDRVLDQGLELSSQDRKRVERARSILSCALDKLKDFELECVAKSSDAALFRTLPLVGKKVVFNTEVRYLTNSFLAAALIHEGTHKCGTTDADYFLQRGKTPQSSWWVEWPKIASSYEYWIFRGFCVPGINCKKVK